MENYGKANAFSIKPVFMPDSLFDFQRYLVEWSLITGKAAEFADCGLGKSAMQMTFAQNYVQNYNKRVLCLTPLAVATQMVEEAAKFGIEAYRSGDGTFPAQQKIIVTNYERIHHFNSSDFDCVICDEAGILKNHSGATRNRVISFIKHARNRLLATATPAPNDIIELGNSVEALGVMRRVEMLAKYFVHDSEDTGNWRLKGHAIDAFWQFVASWARAIRHPKDLGFNTPGYDLPKMKMQLHLLPSKPLEGYLIPMLAQTFDEQRFERRETIEERCAKVAEIAAQDESPFVAWCSLNPESEMLTEMIPGAVELSGSDDDDEKEEKVMAFARGQITRLVTKPKICSHGVNWQHCYRASYFPSHSHEQFYQCVRRFWRFGQKNEVQTHIVTTEAEAPVMDNLKRKENESSEMFKRIVENMAKHIGPVKETYTPKHQIKMPSWIK